MCNDSISLVSQAAGVCEVGYALPLTTGAPQEPVAHTTVQVCPELVWCVGFQSFGQLFSALWAVIQSMEAVPTIWVKVLCLFLRPGYEQ